MKTIFLDRDGVINPLITRGKKQLSPQRLEQFEFLPGAREAIQRAKDAGFRVIVFTNQPDVEKDWRELDREELQDINSELREAGVDAVYACTHGPMGKEESKYYRKDDDIVVCDCRKPQPGLLEKAVEDYSIDISRSFVVGDSRKDIGAAERLEEKTGKRFAGKFGIGISAGDESVDNVEDAIDEMVSMGS